MPTLATVGAFVRLGRPQFLTGGFVLYGLGAALAVLGGAPFDGAAFALGQLVVTATQLSVHYANDYFDLAADRANTTPTRWSGGSRVLPAGLIAPRAALIAALVLLALALAGAAALASAAPTHDWFSRIRLVLLVGVMITLAWSYSAPPLRLAARGLGELTTALVVTLCVPALAYATQAGAPRAALWLATLTPALLQFAMLLAIEFPDAAGDGATGKRTLVVRLGAARAAKLYAIVTVAAFGAGPLTVRAGLPAAIALAPLAVAPLGVWQAARIVRGAYADPTRWEGTSFVAVALLMASASTELVATLILLATRGG